MCLLKIGSEFNGSVVVSIINQKHFKPMVLTLDGNTYHLSDVEKILGL